VKGAATACGARRVRTRGHGLIRMGHVVAGDNPPGDLLVPTVMLLFGMFLLATGPLAREGGRASRPGE